MTSKPKTLATKEEANPARVPKLRFPEFRDAEGWVAKTFDELFTIGNGKDYKHLEAGDVPVYGSGGYMLSVNDYLHDGESVCIGRKGTIDNPMFLTGRFWTVDTLFYTHSFKDCLPKFIFAVFQQIDWLKHNEAGGVPSLSKTNIQKIQTTVPTPAEQQKIAECLSSVDELMAAQARKVDALKTHKKGLMQQLFPREGEAAPRLRFPEFRDAGEWESTTVGGLVQSGCLFPPKDGNHGNIHPKSSDYVTRGIPFIMASDLNGGLIDIENCHFISKEQAETLQKGFAKEGDVLLSHKGTVGEVAVVRKINTPYLMLTPQVTYYRVKDRDRLSNEFLAQLFVSDAFQSNLVEVSGGGTRAYIGITEQAKLRLQLPDDVEEQQRIASCLSSIDALVAAEIRKLEALKTHKKGLMQQLFPSLEEGTA